MVQGPGKHLKFAPNGLMGGLVKECQFQCSLGDFVDAPHSIMLCSMFYMSMEYLAYSSECVCVCFAWAIHVDCLLLLGTAFLASLSMVCLAGLDSMFWLIITCAPCVLVPSRKDDEFDYFHELVVQEERSRTFCPGYEDGLDGAKKTSHDDASR